MRFCATNAPTPTAFLLSSTAFINIVILLATLNRTYVPEKPYVFSSYTHPLQISQTLYRTSLPGYVGREMPLETPTGHIPYVEMTYQESSRFEIQNYTASRPNWDTLIKNQFGLGFHHIGPFHHRFVSAAYHSLHCDYTFGRDMEKPNHLNETSHHLVHCMMYLWQLFMCNADATLEPGDFMVRNLTLDRMGVTRKCRDWGTVAKWIDQNALEWAEYNGVSKEALKQYLDS